MTQSQQLTWEPIRTINSTTFNGSYQPLGGPLLFPSYICKLVNNSNVLITISTDGINDMDVAPSNSYFLYDESKVGEVFLHPALAVGTQFYVKGAASGTNAGVIYLITQYITVS